MPAPHRLMGTAVGRQVAPATAGLLQIEAGIDHLAPVRPAGPVGVLEEQDVGLAADVGAAVARLDERLEEIIEELEPDVIVEDNVVGFPALPASGRPWVRIVSCQPAELKDELVPPAFSGLPTGEPSGWGPYWAEYRRVMEPLHAEHDELFRARGAPGLPELELIGTSPWLNMYLYPEELDYRLEGRNAETFRHNFAGHAHVRIPKVYWSYSRARVLTLELLEGVQLADVDLEAVQGLLRGH